ncbi:hypothetical protein SHY80_11035, partial [Streptococcus suis]|uniref:hypothetical protein n=1 Tax=Streptococcus suis TaxID=1307 RepID=UPI0029C2CC48
TPAKQPVKRIPIPTTAQAFCQDMTQRLPNLPAAVCAKAQLTPLAAKSALGRPLFQRDVISPNAHLRVLVIGGIHGDELSSTSLVLHW